MNEKSKTGLEILQASALIGVLGDVLLREVPWGLNVLLFVVVFIAAFLMLLLWRSPELFGRNTIALSGAVVFFAAMFAWRDSTELLFFDAIAILAALGILVLPNMSVTPRIAGVFHYIIAAVWSGINAAAGAVAVLVVDIDWKTMPRTRLTRHLYAVTRGLVVAIPLVLVFGALFMAADAAYQGLIERTFNMSADKIVTHILLTVFITWIAAGYFRGAILSNRAVGLQHSPGIRFDVAARENGSAGSSPEESEKSAGLPDNATILEHINTEEISPVVIEPAKKEGSKWSWPNVESSVLPPILTLGTIETVVIMGLIDLLFLSFVVVQVPYLFGGMEFVQATPDFKLAEYARRGFGELVAVAALVLPMLLIGHWLLRKDGRMNETIFRILAGVQIILLFVIMASAVQRLFLLTGNLGYGMTTIRLYPMIFMIWLAIVFAWFGMTVLRGARQHFAWGALWSAFFVLAATHVFNPDDFIVRTNVQLMREGRTFDAGYNIGLSDDAIPALLESLDEMSPENACDVKSALNLRRTNARTADDLRSWNWSRLNANSRLESGSEIYDLTGCENIRSW